MKWIRLENNIVIEILPTNPNGLYTQEFVKTCMSVSDEVEVGWIYKNGIFSKPDNRKFLYDSKMVEIVYKRQIKIDSGVIYNENKFDSDQQSKDNITGVLQSLNLGWILPPDFVWMSYDNKPIPFTEKDIKQLAIIITNFTSDVYAKSFKYKIDLQNLYDSGATEQEILNFSITY